MNEDYDFVSLLYSSNKPQGLVGGLMGMLCGKIEIFRMSEIVFWCNGIPCIIIPTIIVHFIVIMWGDCPFRAYFLAHLPCFEGQLFF